MPIECVTGQALGVQIDALIWAAAVDRLLAGARKPQSRYVAISNMHVVTALRFAGCSENSVKMSRR